MEKQIGAAAYWIGILSTIIALVMRGLAAVHIFTFSPNVGSNPISYRTFLEGALLFFVTAIASALIASGKERRA